MNYFKNKKVLVTGASSGIGAELSRQLASQGARLIITARREERLKQLAEELNQYSTFEVMVIPCDLSDPSGPEYVYQQLQEMDIEVDILINNAGFGYNGPFLEGDQEMLHQMIQVNISALVSLTRLILPGMHKRKSGGILNVASMAGFLPIPWFAVYAATKQFVINFSRSLSWELKGSGIHVSVLCSGPVDTEFLQVAGISKRNAVFRGLQSPEKVVRKGLAGLKGNKVMIFSRPVLRVLYLLSKWLPVKFGMMAGSIAMKK